MMLILRSFNSTFLRGDIMGKNALEPLFDLFWDSGAIFFRWLFDGWIKPKTDFEPLWEETKLHNNSKTKPLLVNENNTDKTKTYIFSIPTGLTIKEFMSRKQALAQFLKEDPRNIKIELVNNLATITIYDTSKLNFDYRSYSFDYDTKEIKIPIGISLKNFETVCWHPTSPNECHMLIGGSTGAGKSVCLNVIMEYLINRNDVELYIQDTKVIDLVEYEEASQTKIYNTGTDYATETVLGLVKEMNNRYDYLKARGLKNMSECKAKDKPKTIFYIVEELASYNPRDDKEYYSALAQILAKGRAAGVICVLTTQAPYSEILPGMLKNNINSIIGLKTRTKEASKVIIGDYDLLVNLRGRGHGIFAVNGEYNEVQIFNMG